MKETAPFVQGGIYLAKLDPTKHAEVGKTRPVAILMADLLLAVHPSSVFVCPLSSQSYPACESLHVRLPPRDNLQKESYALVEHCRSISVIRFIEPRIALLTQDELKSIFSRLQLMCDM